VTTGRQTVIFINNAKRGDVMEIKNPLSPNGAEAHISTVLYALAAQGGCDGTPYDEMQFAADYIKLLEARLDDYEKYKAFWEYSRLADKQSFEMYEWKEREG
jgi:hypothetical protein